MGNENSKDIENIQEVNGRIPVKHENGGVNGISLTVTTNGHKVDVPTKLPKDKTVDSPLPEVKTTEYIIVESNTAPPQTKVQPPNPSVPSDKLQTDKEPETPNPGVPVEEVQSRGQERSGLFSKLFMKKSAEKEGNSSTSHSNEDQTDTSTKGHISEKQENANINGSSLKRSGTEVKPATTVDQSGQTDSTKSTEYVVLQSQEVKTPKTPDPTVPNEEGQPKEETVSLFSKMFKKKPPPITEKEPEKEPELHLTEKSQTDQVTSLIMQNDDIHKKHRTGICNGNIPGIPQSEQKSNSPDPEEAEVKTPDPSVPREEIQPKEEIAGLFSKMFKKKPVPVVDTEPTREPEREHDKEQAKKPEKKPEEERYTETTSGDETDRSPAHTGQHLETGKLTAEPEKEVEDGERDSEKKGQESESERGENQDNAADDNPVMSFFKTLVTPTKTKKEAPAPDAAKEQPQASETQPAPATTTTVAQISDPPAPPKGMPMPPPPPPEPPRAQPAVKPKEEPKPKDSPQAKSARDTLTRLFRTKSKKTQPHAAVEDAHPDPQTPLEPPPPVSGDETDSTVGTQDTAEAETVVNQQKPDASKASTLEAAAKPDPAPAAHEEKKPEAKKSVLSFFKPKALFDRVTSTVQTASSGLQLLMKTPAAAADPKATPAPATAEAGPAKEEAPKAAKSPEAPAESKPTTAAPPAGEEAPTPPKKQEKRNSITLFFKNLSQKRPSTDAGAPTEAEKTK
ncbi:breast carcinoma-amplified sequence 1 isoform X2 [Periophthalmus magnuspinnatus]|uniref:breast carcinoma-amplified sequence 1 isoform X2 n=1 Tax=Periophthalmus magnuspinnatus TaxID=409849 RepID=UPI0024364BF8|nr:breast carcinoma-amplified sequence 1 isoform X2 [Periophthalmus magnuspinnatus]